MAAYFVDSANGNDANSGSESSPLRTIARAAALATTGAHQIRLRRGLTFPESIFMFAPFGGTSESNRALFGAYGPASDPLPKWEAPSGTRYCLRLSNTVTPVEFTDIEDIDFLCPPTSLGITNSVMGVLWNASISTAPRSTWVRRCKFHGSGRVYSSLTEAAFGLAMAPSIGGGIEDSQFFDIGSDGITSGGYADYPLLNFVVRRNSFINIAANGYNQGDAIEFGVYPLNGLYLLDNYIDMTNTNGKQAIIVNHAQPDNTPGLLVIEGNTIIRKQFGGPTLDTAYSPSMGIYARNPNTIIRRNTVIGGEYGISLVGESSGRQVTDNIIGRNGVGISIGTTAADLLANNTLYESRAAQWVVVGRAIDRGSNPNASVRNNLIMDSDFGINATVAGGNSHNAFWRNGSNYRLSANSGGGDVTSDPVVSQGYRPLPGSPLIGAGTHLGYRRDKDGRQRQNPPCIGAYDVATMRRALSAA